jgi:preprotein translocase subunit SecA
MAGRGVDILLGGNPELLAQREVLSQGFDLASEEGEEAFERAYAIASENCAREAELVRAAGGLYVLGSERHESRRIDNQLRGRSGRQGDAGESRFFLSLEDELLRLFATGALSWVMGRTLPDDQPIEAKMVTKAIERAQNTVEGRNAEIRKDVLKYDAVMNEQRKVIYGWRLRIMDGENLEERTTELLDETCEALVKQCCPGDYPESWDLEQLLVELHQYYPTRFTVDDLRQAQTQAQVIDSVVEEALDFYERHAEELPGGVETARMIERDIMLQIIDQRWQEHLAEMDYLREGINLRAVAQQDPLVAWQREGFSMFGAMIEAIEDDYLRYVLHVEAAPEDAAEVDLNRAVYVAADDPVADSSTFAQLAPDTGQMVDATEKPTASFNPADFDEVLQPIVKAPEEKLGRNEPCYCGSGRKFKFCHGAAGR